MIPIGRNIDFRQAKKAKAENLIQFGRKVETNNVFVLKNGRIAKRPKRTIVAVNLSDSFFFALVFVESGRNEQNAHFY